MGKPEELAKIFRREILGFVYFLNKNYKTVFKKCSKFVFVGFASNSITWLSFNIFIVGKPSILYLFIIVSTSGVSLVQSISVKIILYPLIFPFLVIWSSLAISGCVVAKQFIDLDNPAQKILYFLGYLNLLGITRWKLNN